MTEIAYTVARRRWIGSKLNPDRIERYYVRGKSRADCARIISAHGEDRIESYELKTYGHMWGNVARPTHEGRGLWITRDHFDNALIEVWIDDPNA
jgi:hypothetical protein